MTVRVKVEGLAELQRKLRKLDAAEVKDLAQGPLEGAGRILQREVENRAPRDRGTLAENIDTAHDPDIEYANVRVYTKDAAFHGLFQEFGWVTAGGKRVPGKAFMRPAYQATKGEVQKYAVRGIAKAIERRAPNL